MNVSGTSFTCASIPRFYYGTLALVSADNPASNDMGGFKKSSSALRHCRQCLGTQSETREEVCVYAVMG